MKLISSMMCVFGFFLLHLIIIIFLCIGLLPRGSAIYGILGNESDRLALLAFKDLIHHDPWQVTSSWNDSLHFCKWEGITCSRQRQRVTALNLNSLGLVGSISPSIGNLSFLRIINLQNNSFQSVIPQEVGRLFRLQSFLVDNNSFVGEIPVNLSHCSNLQSLSLSFNNLVGKASTEIGSLSKLVLLDLMANNLTGEIPSSFGNLSYLENFSLARNNLHGNIPDPLGQLKSLKTFSLAANMLSSMIPSSLYNLSSCETFSVAVNQLSGSLPLEIGLTLPNLHHFFIAGNQFFGSIPISLFINVSSLEIIELSECKFTGKVPANVGGLKGLQFLNLGANNLGSGKAGDLNFLNSLTNCTHLRMLDIDYNHFEGKLPNSIANLSRKMEEMFLGGNQISGNIPVGIENLDNLFSLAMEMNFFTGPIPSGIGMLHKLQLLTLEENKLSGPLPSSLGNISQLYVLELSNNILEGNIISDLARCRFLNELGLAGNNLNGTIPKQLIIGLSSLTSLNLAHNSFTGSLPFEVGKMESLQSLRVAENRLSGQIPSSLGSCFHLQYLYLEGNFFQGPIPSSFSSLKDIRDLDLSRNNLSGKIPKSLEDLSHIEHLNISFNDFEGEVPIKGVFQNASAFAFVGNNQLCGGIPKLQLPTCPTNKSKQGGISLAFKVAIVVILFSIVVASFLTFYWRRKPRMKSASTFFLGDWYKRVSYNGLYKATDGFASDNLIGMGKFGSVYKGILRPDEIPIAVKVLNLNVQGASKSFMAECKALRKVRHRNLLKILTVCSSVDFRGNDFKALVFDFMPNGSLENWLHPSSDERHLSRNLTLRQRLSIAIDIASALEYLHKHCLLPVIHCDLKPSNILLDDDMTAHVGDFGLAKILAGNTNISSESNETNSVLIKGSVGYIPPEYGMGAEVSMEGDVYSYGILLLELLTGKRPTDEIFKDGLSLHHFSKMALSTGRVMEIVDPCLLLEEDHSSRMANDFELQRNNIISKTQEYLVSIFKIGVACSTESLGGRMEIKDFLKDLQMIQKIFLEDNIH